MKWKRTKQKLQVELSGDFNLAAVRKIRSLLGSQTELHLDLSSCRFADSEAIIFLHEQIQKHLKVRLVDPPLLFYEVLRILGIQDEWDLKQIVVR
ncbi:STAS domain-containing protein [Balneola sp. MJW-20]|uniref:STAS domain-containing protein n=1 Tax=Gracilimonas aurantiaca TaxID=3234185 RepID=UPI003467C892